VRESYLFRIDCSPPARIWSGVGSITIPADAIETTGGTYHGGGAMLNAPDFQQLINGAAERIEFQVSGVTPEMLALATTEAASVKGAKVHLGRIEFDDNWQQTGTVEWEAQFRCDSLTVASQDGGQSGRNRTITLSVATDDTNRSMAPMAFFTDADQKKRSSTDTIFDHVAAINAGTSRRFGPKT
jgi:hypothetical protein